MTYPLCLTDAQIEAEVQKYITAHSLPSGLGVEYFVLTPYNVGSCFDTTSSTCAYSYYCAYHSEFSDSRNPSSPVLYANMPWLYSTGCDINVDGLPAGYPNADGIDPVVGVFSHEASETMTDPEPNTGWVQRSGPNAGYEIGDKCAYIYGSGGYGSLTGLANNGLGVWNVALSGDDYLMQLEFSNFNATCEKTDTQTQPSYTPTVTPNPPVHGSPATFKVVVTDAIGVAYVTWNFGDGVTTTSSPYSATSSTTVTTTHTYAAAGARTLTVVVTDEKGNEVKKTLTYTVS